MTTKKFAKIKLSFIIPTAVVLFFISIYAASSIIRRDARALLIQDIEYMHQTLKDNFALYEFAYQAEGVDISSRLNWVRRAVTVIPFMGERGLHIALTVALAPLNNIGHFSIVTHRQYNDMTTNFHSLQRLRLSPSGLARLRYPHVENFYSSRRNNAQMGALSISQLFTPITVYADTLHPNIDRNIEISIRYEERIAYISIASFTNFFLPTWRSEQSAIFDFFEEVQDFEHLIVDIRGNTGGGVQYFIEAFVQPNISESIRLDAYVFLVYGEYSAEFTSPLYNREFNRGTSPIPIDRELRPFYQMFEQFSLPEFNLDDAKRFQYGFRSRKSISPGFQSRFNNQPAFDGYIWLLVDESNGSGAQIAAWIAKESGFATLVGDVTGGNYGGPVALVALPNTGILFQFDVFYVTDHRGRSFEAGTTPHYSNFPRADAFETVLQIIGERRALNR